jgi:predicted transcriptional regulator
VSPATTRKIGPLSEVPATRYDAAMNLPAPVTDHAETEAERQRRIAWEADRIAEAQASAAAGRLIPSEEVDAWIDSLDTNHELPPPRSGR